MPLVLSWIGVAPPKGHLWHIGAADPDGHVYLCHRDPTRADGLIKIGRFAALSEARLAAQLIDAAASGRPLRAPAAPWRLATEIGEMTLRQESAATRLVIESGRSASDCIEIARLFRLPAVAETTYSKRERELQTCVLCRLAELRCLRPDTSPLEPLVSGNLMPGW